MIKNIQVFSLLLLLTLLNADAESNKQTAAYNPYKLQPGDIVFQSGNSLQDKAVMAATHSRWSHVGLIFFYQGSPWVFEAVQPVKTTPLKEFISRNPSDFFAMRLKNAKRYINEENIHKAELSGKEMLGVKYDPYFQWTNDKLYCSELVWKIYKQATGLQLCTPRKVSSYDLDSVAMQKLITQRFGSMKNLPMNEIMVAPGDIARSSLLIEAPRKDELTSNR